MPSPDRFPDTRWSVVLRAGDGETAIRRRALEELCRTYWLPIYAFARGQGLSPPDAEDLTQDVLGGLLKHGDFERIVEGRGKLRSFLRVATKNHLRSDWRRARCQKRGGGAEHLSLDWKDAERRCVLEPSDDETPDRLFDRHWAINLLHRTMERLESHYTGEGKGELFAALKEVLGRKSGGPSYRELAGQLSMSEGAVKVAVHRLRKRYRTLLRQEIARTLDNESEEAIEEEVRSLFGVFAG